MESKARNILENLATFAYSSPQTNFPPYDLPIFPSIRGIVENFLGILGPHHFSLTPESMTFPRASLLERYCSLEPRLPTKATSEENIFLSSTVRFYIVKKDDSNACVSQKTLLLYLFNSSIRPTDIVKKI